VKPIRELKKTRKGHNNYVVNSSASAGNKVKVLLFCPTYKLASGELAIHNETLKSIEGLSIPDNVELEVEISTNNPNPITGNTKQDHENTLYQYRYARQRIIGGDYEYLFIIEHDMIIPEDALVKMLATDADVVYGLYQFRHSKPILNACRAVNSRWPDMTLSLFPEIVEKAKAQGWIEVSGAGFGCTLIRRNVLETFDMRRSELGGHPCPDMPFAADCMRNGFKQVCRFDVICGHIKPNGDILIPFKRGEAMSESIKIYVMRSFNANIGGKSVPYKEGDTAEMPSEYVDDYVRCGYITYAEEPAVKIANKPKVKATKTVKKVEEAE
jgi:hypothetical protein